MNGNWNWKSTLLAALLLVAAGAAAASADLWIHVRVDEGDGRSSVKVNLPLALIESAAPLVSEKHLHHRGLHLEHMELELEEMREIWQSLRDSPDMTFVTVEETDERVRVWKEAGTLYVEVNEADGAEQVNVKVPVAVVDALLAGDRLDLEAAVSALAAHGHGEIVTVRDRGETVRVWIDDRAEGE